MWNIAITLQLTLHLLTLIIFNCRVLRILINHILILFTSMSSFAVRTLKNNFQLMVNF